MFRGKPGILTKHLSSKSSRKILGSKKEGQIDPFKYAYEILKRFFGNLGIKKIKKKYIALCFHIIFQYFLNTSEEKYFDFQGYSFEKYPKFTSSDRGLMYYLRFIDHITQRYKEKNGNNLSIYELANRKNKNASYIISSICTLILKTTEDYSHLLYTYYEIFSDIRSEILNMKGNFISYKGFEQYEYKVWSALNFKITPP